MRNTKEKIGFTPLETIGRQGRDKMSLAGFSLVEIMVVMAVVGLLVSIIMIEGINLRKQANESNAQANLKTIAIAFEVYAARFGGLYAPSEAQNLSFLVEAGCLYQDIIGIGQIGNFRYSSGYIGPSGYDIRAMAVNQNLADHNYQVVTGGVLRRSDTASPGDTDFKIFR